MSAAPTGGAGTVDPAAAAGDDPAFGAVVETIQSTYAYMPAALAGYLAGVGVVAMLYWSIAPTALMLPWIGAFVLMCVVRGFVIRAFRRATPGSHADWLRWRLRSNIGTVVAGSLWGAAGWMFYGLGAEQPQTTGLIVIIYTFAVAGIPVLSIQPRLYLMYAVLCLLPLVVRIALVGNLHSYQLAAELILIISLTALLANSYRQALQRAIDLKVQADELAAKLRVETLAADAARREAEIANRAKTQFFTAASHDLRQPLHAMGLFAEALRQRSRDAEAASLINSINESVDALEGLFGELLDITRIDSGGVDVHPAPVRLRELFARLRLHFEPVAFEKGLQLGFRGERHVAVADPVQLERILRNLVSNAIRYTDDGGVLVSCRPRAGKLLLQVWDSGIGIAPAALPRIFDEFYQVQSQRPLEAHQRKGLGLGLAIVQRLAALMSAPLTVRSRVGRGTVFTLELPVGKAPRENEPAMPSSKSLPGLTLHGRRIVVIEDEAAVREGLVVLLKSWGAEVEAYDTLDALREGLAAPGTEAPHLLLVDYRLPQGTTGLAAIDMLRARWPQQTLPAIVITGSSLGGHEDEALRHDFHLLIKPVLPARLRAMIAFKLGVR